MLIMTKSKREEILFQSRDGYIRDNHEAVDVATKEEMELVNSTANEVTEKVLKCLAIPKEAFDKTHRQLASIEDLQEILNAAQEGKLKKPRKGEQVEKPTLSNEDIIKIIKQMKDSIETSSFKSSELANNETQEEAL